MANYDALTDDERAFIKEHLSDMTVGEIALSLGRNYYTIISEMRRIGHYCYHKWTDKEDTELKSLWGENYSAEYISRKMRIGVDGIYNRIRRLKKNGKWLEREKK